MPLLGGIREKLDIGIHLRFRNRSAAAMILADLLKTRVPENDRMNFMIVGIARAGVVTAHIVAQKMHIVDFGIVIPRKLTFPDDKERAIGAVMEDGTTYLVKQGTMNPLVTKEYLEKEKANQLDSISARSKVYGFQAGKSLSDQLASHEKFIILVDDGASTGATIISVIKWIDGLKLGYRNRRRRLLVAVPVIPRSTADLIRLEYDLEVQVVTSPSKFYSVQEYYQEFREVTDDEVVRILSERGLIRQESRQTLNHTTL
jgi:predicted phosphoribosyltransferase